MFYKYYSKKPPEFNDDLNNDMKSNHNDNKNF